MAFVGGVYCRYVETFAVFGLCARAKISRFSRPRGVSSGLNVNNPGFKPKKAT